MLTFELKKQLVAITRVSVKNYKSLQDIQIDKILLNSSFTILLIAHGPEQLPHTHNKDKFLKIINNYYKMQPNLDIKNMIGYYKTHKKYKNIQYDIKKKVGGKRWKGRVT